VSWSVSGGVVNEVPARLCIPDSADRDDLGAFAARVVRLDQSAAIRLRAVDDQVVAWAPTPFEVLTTRAVRGELRPADLTVPAAELLATLAVLRNAEVDPGGASGARWLVELPPDGPSVWRPVDEVPATELEELAEQGLVLAQERAGPHGTPPDALLDQVALTVHGHGMRVPVPLRCLFALSGMGLLGGGSAEDLVRVLANDSWLRLDTRHGAVVRRRRALLPLVF
jgi:hypothetical protein